MPYAILRVAKLKTKGQASAATGHNYRQHPVPNVDVEAPHPNREYVNTAQLDYWTLAEQRIQEAGVKRIRSDSVKAMEVIMTGSPEAFIRRPDGRAADYSKSQWAADNLRFLKEQFGEKNVVSFTLHQDETTPHVHAVVVPITQDGRLSADQLFNPKSLRQLQTDYAQAMGPHGMQRGVEHSQAKHQPMSRMYGVQVQAAGQVAQLATPSVPASIALSEPPRLVGREEWKREEEARINAEVARQVAEGNSRLEKVASVAQVNTSAKQEADVLRKQLHTSEQAKQGLSDQLKETSTKLEAATTRLDVVAVQVAQQDVPAVDELARYGATVRERSRQDLEQTLAGLLKGPVKDGAEFMEKVRTQGFEFAPSVEGRPSTFTDPLTTAKFTSGEVKPNGEALRPQLEAAIERTAQQAQARSQARDRSQDKGVSM
jgi:hypothetical protein